MRPATWSGAADTPAALAVRAGVVSRPGLFELLDAAGRVTEVSAPAGSGKTLLLMRAPARLRFVLATRHDLRLGLHRLRLEGELTEISVIAADAELAARMAGDQLGRGSLDEAERYLALAAEGLASAPPGRRERSQVVLALVRMRLARQRGDLPAVAEQAQRLLAPAGAADPARLGLGEDQPA